MDSPRGVPATSSSAAWGSNRCPGWAMENNPNGTVRRQENRTETLAQRLTAQTESFACSPEIVCFVQLQLPAGVRDAQAALPPLLHQAPAQEPRRGEFGSPRSQGGPGLGCQVLPWPLLQAVRHSQHPIGNSLGVVLRAGEIFICTKTSPYLRDALRTTTFQNKVISTLPAAALTGLQLLSFRGSCPMETKPSCL